MQETCPQLRIKLTELKSLFSNYCLELEQAKTTKEFDSIWNIQAKLEQAILELRLEVDPDKYYQEYTTEIERKAKANIPLSKAEITFLYDIDHIFGYQRDPRIKEILQTRNPKEDAPIVFDCQPSEIAWDIKQVNENTKAYIGQWSVDIFQIIRNYPNITHLYESFPDKKIFMQTLETDPSINSPAKAEQVLKDKNIWISEWGRNILEKTKFSQTSEVYNLVRFTVEQLGFPNGATTDEIYTRAQELVLELCPAEIVPQLRLKYTGRERFFIATKQIAGHYGAPDVFSLRSYGAELVLDGGNSRPVDRWYSRNEFVFRFRLPVSPSAKP